MANAKYADLDFAKGWPSVTTITGMKDKPFLARWRGKIGNAEADRIMYSSQAIGGLVENYIDHWFEDKDAATNQKLEDKVFECEESKKFYYQAVKNFHVFADKFKPTPHLTQQVVYNRVYRYVGTFDRTFFVDGNLILGDWKATNSVHDEYWLQLEAYYRAIEDMKLPYFKDIKGLWLCQFPKQEDINLDKHIYKFQPDEVRFKKGFATLLEHWWWDSDSKKAKGDTKKTRKK